MWMPAQNMKDVLAKQEELANALEHLKENRKTVRISC